MVTEVLFTHSNKIGSRLIQWGTGEPFSHVALFFPELRLIVQSTGSRGVHATSISNFLKHNSVVRRITLREQGLNTWQQFLSQVNLPYDYLTILKLSFELFVYKLTLKRCKLKISDSHARICTEFASVCILNSEQGLTPGELEYVLLSQELGDINEEPLNE